MAFPVEPNSRLSHLLVRLVDFLRVTTAARPADLALDLVSTKAHRLGRPGTMRRHRLRVWIRDARSAVRDTTTASEIGIKITRMRLREGQSGGGTATKITLAL